MTSALTDVAWVLLGVCALMLVVAFFLPNLQPRPKYGQEVRAQ